MKLPNLSFRLVKERWYHKILDKILPEKDINNSIQIATLRIFIYSNAKGEIFTNKVEVETEHNYFNIRS